MRYPGLTALEGIDGLSPDLAKRLETLLAEAYTAGRESIGRLDHVDDELSCESSLWSADGEEERHSFVGDNEGVIRFAVESTERALDEYWIRGEVRTYRQHIYYADERVIARVGDWS